METQQNLESGFLKLKNISTDLIKLTQRDLDIIRFCLEMRFATIAQLHQRFFNKSHSGDQSKCDRWTQERLYKLRQSNYLKLQKNFLTGENLILPTIKGYQLIKKHFYFEDLPKPITYIDFRQFEHDKLLIDCRTQLEKTKQIKRWISERCLQSRPEVTTSFRDDSIADALCITSIDESFYFELELSLKTKERYKKKIKRYVYILRSEKPMSSQPKSVLFVCSKVSIQKAILNETKIYGPLFSIVLIEDFFKQN